MVFKGFEFLKMSSSVLKKYRFDSDIDYYSTRISERYIKLVYYYLPLSCY